MDPIFDFKEFIGLVAVVLSLGVPMVAIVMAFIAKMKKNQQEKELRQLIIENKTDAETAKLLIDEPKKAAQPRKPGTIDLGTLRTACILLGAGLGALINWLCGLKVGDLYFWFLVAFGIGVGMLCSFLVEMRLFKKYGENKQTETTVED